MFTACPPQQPPFPVALAPHLVHQAVQDIVQHVLPADGLQGGAEEPPRQVLLKGKHVCQGQEPLQRPLQVVRVNCEWPWPAQPCMPGKGFQQGM